MLAPIPTADPLGANLKAQLYLQSNEIKTISLSFTEEFTLPFA